jgi:hypothetical protein
MAMDCNYVPSLSNKALVLIGKKKNSALPVHVFCVGLGFLVLQTKKGL